MFNCGKKSFLWEKVKFQRYCAEKMLEIWGNKRVTLHKLRGLINSLDPRNCNTAHGHSLLVLLPFFLPIPCIHPRSYSLNEFSGTCLVFPQLSEPSGPSQTPRGAQSQSTCPSIGLPSHSLRPPTFLLTKQVHLNLFSVSSTFSTLWTLANTTLCVVSPLVLLPLSLLIPCVWPSSYSPNKFV